MTSRSKKEGKEENEQSSTRVLQKNQKKAIPKAIKQLVWNFYIGEEIGKTECFCCGVTKITQLSFVCGHVQAEANGGNITIDNLRPVCSMCNSSMGTKNMIDFMKTHGLKGKTLTFSKSKDEDEDAIVKKEKVKDDDSPKPRLKKINNNEKEKVKTRRSKKTKNEEEVYEEKNEIIENDDHNKNFVEKDLEEEREQEVYDDDYDDDKVENNYYTITHPPPSLLCDNDKTTNREENPKILKVRKYINDNWDNIFSKYKPEGVSKDAYIRLKSYDFNLCYRLGVFKKYSSLF